MGKTITIWISLSIIFFVSANSNTLAQAPDQGETSDYYTLSETRQLGSPKPDKSLVYFTRTYRYWIFGLAFQGVPVAWTFIDDRFAGVIDADSYTYTHVEPGEHIIWTTKDHKKSLPSGIRVKLEPGKTYFFNISATSEPRVWVQDRITGKQILKKIPHRTIATEKAKAVATKLIASSYSRVRETATRYPLAMVSNHARLSRFYGPDTYRYKKYPFYFATDEKTYGDVRTGKALIYILSRENKNQTQPFRVSSFWTFADDQLLSVAFREKYAYAWVDPGVHLFWAVNYFPPHTKDFSVSAIRMRVAAGKTYFIETNQYFTGFHGNGLKLRVVPEDAGRRILEDTAYMTTITKKAHRKKSYFIKKFYGRAKKVTASYPQTSLGGTYFRPKTKK